MNNLYKIVQKVYVNYHLQIYQYENIPETIIVFCIYTLTPGESIVMTATSSTTLHLKCFLFASVANVLDV